MKLAKMIFPDNLIHSVFFNLFVNKHANRFLPLVGQFFFAPNQLNKLVELRI
jgi:hypothetical protein